MEKWVVDQITAMPSNREEKPLKKADTRSQHVNFECHRQIIFEMEVSSFSIVPGLGSVQSARGYRTADQSLISEATVSR
jgi:hypothetical protein